MGDATPTRDPASRAALRASVLVMMLISVSAQASARGINEVSHSARVALQTRMIAERLLPMQTEAGLARGIRFEIAQGFAAAMPAGTIGIHPGHRPAPAPRLLRDALLSLPPPAC